MLAEKVFRGQIGGVQGLSIQLHQKRTGEQLFTFR